MDRHRSMTEGRLAKSATFIHECSSRDTSRYWTRIEVEVADGEVAEFDRSRLLKIYVQSLDCVIGLFFFFALNLIKLYHLKSYDQCFAL